MKVPIRYKSSDRYNAGVDVVYDDESKLEYAPFVYATTASGDNGGDDEEGEDSMVVNIDTNTMKLDKTWTEINNAVVEGKTVMVVPKIGTHTYIQYVADISTDGEPIKYVIETIGFGTTGVFEVSRYTSDTSDGTLVIDA